MKSLFLCASQFLFSTALIAQPGTARVALNQIGFYPDAPKIAVVTGVQHPSAFFVISENGNDTVFTGQLSGEIKSSNSSLTTRIADFSALQKQGVYTLAVPSAARSYSFLINANACHSVAIGALKGYYFARSNMPLDEKWAGKWKRASGHPDLEVEIHPSAAGPKRAAGSIISTPGGWYDAGDYNKYVVNSGITMGTLLSAYEDFNSYFDSAKSNIPESTDAVPDILNEIVYNLRWMLTMQDPDDGGVYNKCTNAGFDGMVMPGVTKLPRYVVQKGVAASLDFAAVAAQASRVLAKFKKVFPALSDSCIKAAEKAWTWSLLHPNLEYNQDSINKIYQPKITTGGYGDKQFDDEWFWAAAELYITTGNGKYMQPLRGSWTNQLYTPSWGRLGTLGIYSLIRHQKKLPALARNIDSIKPALVVYADNWIKKSEQSAFKTVMGQTPRDFVWGSNAVAANQGILLVQAYLITGQNKYLTAALSNLDYILGRNATGYCFVTGFGSKSPMHPHHRPSVADGIEEPVPGLLAGGPNPGKQDGCKYEFSEPETTYVDLDCSYASNEIAINWNAPLVYLANAIEALQYRGGFSRK